MDKLGRRAGTEKQDLEGKLNTTKGLTQTFPVATSALMTFPKPHYQNQTAERMSTCQAVQKNHLESVILPYLLEQMLIFTD